MSHQQFDWDYYPIFNQYSCQHYQPIWERCENLFFVKEGNLMTKFLCNLHFFIIFINEDLTLMVLMLNSTVINKPIIQSLNKKAYEIYFNKTIHSLILLRIAIYHNFILCI